MEVKKFNPITVLYFTRKVTLTGLQEFVRVKARELFKDAIISDLEVTGPVYWIYYGMDGNPQTLFTLEVAIPVTANDNYKGEFQIKKLEPFKCLSAWHKGVWGRLPLTYGSLFHEMADRNFIPSGECREIYQHIDFLDEENNLTEVQVGIQ
jgi:effector-binding domain-containing protein